MRQRSLTPDWIDVIVFRSSDFRVLLDFAEEGTFKITQDCVVHYSGSFFFSHVPLMFVSAVPTSKHNQTTFFI